MDLKLYLNVSFHVFASYFSKPYVGRSGLSHQHHSIIRYPLDCNVLADKFVDNFYRRSPCMISYFSLALLKIFFDSLAVMCLGLFGVLS